MFSALERFGNYCCMETEQTKHALSAIFENIVSVDTVT